MGPPTSAEIGATDLESLWFQHKDILYRSYIIENKTLKQVKFTMEHGHDFPALRLHDYEVALRELLKFKKNLKREDWYTIGIHISNRKRQGKETEVLWNNSAVAPRKVRKEVLRNRKLRQPCPRTTGPPELPVDVVIRTPPGSPSGKDQEIPPVKTQTDLCLDPEDFISLPHGIGNICHVDQSTRNVQITLYEPAEIGTSRFRYLREHIPFNRFMSELLNLTTSHKLLVLAPAERICNPGPRLFGCNPSLDILARFTFELSNDLFIDWRADLSNWFLTWLGASADFAVLRAFFSVKTPTACAMFESLCHAVRKLRDPSPARVLFEIHEAVAKRHLMTVKGFDFLRIAVRIGSKENGMLEIAKRAFQHCVPSRERVGLRYLFLSAAAHRDIAMMKLLVNAVAYSAEEAHFDNHLGLSPISGVLRHLCALDTEDAEEETTIADYIQLAIQGRILLPILSARCYDDSRPKVTISRPASLTIDELVMICPPMKRRRIYSIILQWSSEHRALVSKAGIFNAALDGPQCLGAYLQSCKQNSDFEIRVTMQESLLFAASLNDTETASALLQLGVDPDVGLLSRNQERYQKGDVHWNPMIVAATAGNLEILELLVKKVSLTSFLNMVPLYEIVQLKNTFDKYGSSGRELRRLENLHRHLLCSQRALSDACFTDGRANFNSVDLVDTRFPGVIKNSHHQVLYPFVSTKKRLDTLIWIRNIAAAHSIGESFDKAIIEATLSNDPDLETRQLQRRICAYHPCDVLLLEGLVDKNLDYREGDMDLLHLSIRSQCSLRVVEFLLSKGFSVHSQPDARSGHTMLHDALRSHSRDRSKIVERLLREGADYKHRGQGLTILEASLHEGQWMRRCLSELDPELRKEDIGLFKRLFDAGAPVTHRPRPQLQNWQPLTSTLLEAEASDDLILEVIDAGVDLNERTCVDGPVGQSDWTPLQEAISRGRETLAKELLRRGADVHAPARGVFGCTALQIACWVPTSFQFIEYLVAVHGAKVNEPPSEVNGKTALQRAASNGCLTLAEFLLDHGADVNALSGYLRLRFKDQQTFPRRFRALDCAAQMGKLDMVEFLLKAGGRSSRGCLGGAIHVAERRGYSAIVSVLLDWEKEHGMRMVEEEVEWQRQQPDAACLLSDVSSDDGFSDDPRAAVVYLDYFRDDFDADDSEGDFDF